MLVKDDENTTREYAPGLVCRKLIDGSNGAAELSLVRGLLRPGAEHGLHTHQTEEVVYVLSGEAEVTIDGRVFIAKAGDALCFPSGSLHATINRHPSEDFVFVAAFNDHIIDGQAVKQPTAGPWFNRLRWLVRRLMRRLNPRL